MGKPPKVFLNKTSPTNILTSCLLIDDCLMPLTTWVGLGKKKTSLSISFFLFFSFFKVLQIN